MKKLFALLLALVMALALAACGEKDPAPPGSRSTADPGTSQTTDPGTSQQKPSNTPDSNMGDASAWPTNQYIDLLPKPKGGTVFSDKAVDNAYFQGHSIIMTDWSLEDCEAYAEDIIAAGFT